jgi:hypothetical protein
MLQDIYHEPANLPLDIEVSVDGNVIFYDDVRGKDLSVARHNLQFFSHQKKLIGKKWLEYASRLPSNLNSFMAQRNLTITNVSINIQSYARCIFRIYLNDNQSSIYSLNVVNEQSIVMDNLNIDVDKLDIIKCELEITSGFVDYPILNLEYAWRY